MGKMKKYIAFMISTLAAMFLVSGCAGNGTIIATTQEQGANSEAPINPIDNANIETIDGGNIGTGQVAPASRALVQFDFSSVEEFIEALRAVRDGTATEQLAENARRVDFTSLERLYLPIAIPEEYRLHRISLNDIQVTITFFREYAFA